MKLQLIRPGSPAIYACKKNNIPSLVFYYIAEQDAIVLNEAHKSFKHFRELLISYLEFDDLQKKEFLVMPRRKGITFFDSVNKVLRISRKINTKRGEKYVRNIKTAVRCPDDR